MVEVYENIKKQFDVETHLKNSFYSLVETLSPDVAGVIVCDKTNNFDILLKESSSYSNEEEGITKECLNEASNSYFELVSEERNILLYRRDEDDKTKDYNPFFNNIYQEMCIPLINKKENIIGCLVLGYYTKEKAISIDSLLQYDVSQQLVSFNSFYETWYKKHKEKDEFMNTVLILMEIVRNKDPFMAYHPYSVAQWATAIAKELDLERETINKIYLACILHDIGKLYIPGDILNKATTFTSKDYEAVKKHPEYSYHIIKNLPKCEYDLKDIARIVLYHHERYDGKGYPYGLKGDNIPLESRIIAVADAVDAMMSERSYKKPRSIDYIIKELIKNKGKQFDPDITKIMIDMLLRTKEINEDILSLPVLWATLCITTYRDSITIDGTLLKTDNGHAFNFNHIKLSEKIEDDKVKRVNLYIKEKKNIHMFTGKIDNMDNNNIYLSDLNIEPTYDTFYVLWELIGKIVKDNHEIQINIYKISGNGLFFSVDDPDFDPNFLVNMDAFSLKILFDDDVEIITTAKTTYQFMMNNVHYYHAKYINISDPIKDKIYRELFRRQIEVKKLSKIS